MAVARSMESQTFVPPPIGLNTRYILWAATLLGLCLASLTLIINLSLFTINGLSEFLGLGAIAPKLNHGRWLLTTGVIAALAGLAQLLRMRSDALARKVITIRFPDELLAQTGGDTILDKFQCRARIEIDVFCRELEADIKKEPANFRDLLQTGLAVAINDPVVRYSKSKIEETLKMSLGSQVDLRDVAQIHLLKLSQKRLLKPIERSNDALDEDGLSQGLPLVNDQE